MWPVLFANAADLADKPVLAFNSLASLLVACSVVLAPMVAGLVWIVNVVVALRRDIDSRALKDSVETEFRSLKERYGDELRAVKDQMAQRGTDMAVLQTEMRGLATKMDDLRALMTQALSRDCSKCSRRAA